MNLNWIPELAWFGTERALQDVVEATCLVRESADIRVLNPQAFFTPGEADEDDTEGLDGERDETGLLLRFGNVGILDIKGGLTNSDSWLNPLFGFTSYGELRQALVTAAEDDQIQALLLNIDSPGGDANGLGETARLIQTIDRQVKPVLTYSGGAMNSAAYWLGMQGRQVFVSDMADVGSIGVIAVHKEVTEMLKQEGTKVTVLRAGKYKALGNPYEKLSEEARAELQGHIDKLHGRFLDAVSQARRIDRSEVQARVGQGKVYLGAEAVTAGLADEVLYFNDAVARTQQVAGRRLGAGNSASTPSSVGVTGEMSRKLRISEKVQAALAAGVAVTELPPDVLAGADPEPPGEDPAPAPAPEEGENPDEGQANNGEGEAPPPAPVGEKGAPPPNPGAAITAQFGEINSSGDLVNYLQSRLGARDEEILTLRLQAERLQSELNELKANRPSLLAIARESVQRMQIALGGAPMPLEHLTDGALVAEHARVSQVFGTRFRVGGVAQVAQESDVNDDSAVGQAFKQRLQAVRFGKAAGEK